MSDAYGYESVGLGTGYKSGRASQITGNKIRSYYPSPFFDVAGTYLPSSTREMFRYCRYYTLTNPLIATTTYKLASYPITETLYETEHEGLARFWKNLFERQFQMRAFVVECNLDRVAYGNYYVSVELPFTKHLKCRLCEHQSPVNQCKYRFHSFAFHMECRKCGTYAEAEASDRQVMNPKGIRLVRWNPETIIVRYNEATGQRAYFYDVPVHIKNDIMLGRPSTVERTPQPIIDALKRHRAVVFSDGHLFHSRQPSISRFDAGLGIPRLLPVLKDTFYMQLLKKSQEAIMFGYILPMRAVYPAPSSGAGGDPHNFLNLSDWKEKVSNEILTWRRDPLHIPVFPVPLGYQNIGGDGKQLTLFNEIRALSEHIVTGMGVPLDFVFGGASYAGTSVTMRALENEFIGTREDNLALLWHVRDKVAAFTGAQSVEMKFRPFKMADDLQRAAFDMQLAAQGKLSWRTMLEQRDYDIESETDRIEFERNRYLDIERKDQEFRAETQGKTTLILSRYQMAATPVPTANGQSAAQLPQDQSQGQPQENPPIPAAGGIVGVQGPALDASNVAQVAAGGMNGEAMAEQWAEQINQAPQEMQGSLLGKLKGFSPELYGMVLSARAKKQAGSGQLPSASDRFQGSV